MDLINKYKKGVELEIPEMKLERKELKKNNVSTDEVVAIIKQHWDIKFKYTWCDAEASLDLAASVEKITEIASIFIKMGNEKEWDKMVTMGISNVFRMKIVDINMEIQEGDKIPFFQDLLEKFNVLEKDGMEEDDRIHLIAINKGIIKVSEQSKIFWNLQNLIRVFQTG